MLKRVVITNYVGESMEYRIDGVQAENESGLIITSIDGLGPVKADINMTKLVTSDGDLFNSARLNGRNIVIKAVFTHASSIEEARLLSYKYFPIKQKLTFRIETDNRSAETTGYVESNEPDIFSELSGCQISVLCESPFFDGDEVEYTMSNLIPNFKFAFGNESLTQKLIKMSEEVGNRETHEIVYGGDAETGIELKIQAPSKDIMDTFSITGITIKQEGVGELTLDTSKMSNVVPNSAPENILLRKCSFIMNESKCKFFRELPFATDGSVFLHNDKIHYFDTTGRHMVLDQSKNLFNVDWEVLPQTNLPQDHSYACMVNFNETIYLYDWQANSILKLNEQTNSWVTASQCPTDLNTNISAGKRAVVYDGAIHFFMTSGTSTYGLKHYKWDGTNWSQVSYPNNYFGYQYSFDNSIVIAFNDKIHVLGGLGSGNAAYRHDIWDGNEWSSLSNLPEASAIAGTNLREAIVYKGRLHIFLNHQGHHHSWISDEEGWVEEFSLGWNGFIYKNGFTSMVTDGRYIFLAGWQGGSGTYTEDPNNVKLIGNDELIINSNTGKKSLYLRRGLEEYNVLNMLDKNPTWFKLQRGVNRFSYSAETDEDNMQVTIVAHNWYEGV